MIYKCKNCGLEYDTPVDYCECGNNTFEIINTVSQNNPHVTEDEFDEYGEKITKSEKISPENNSDLEFLYQTKHKSVESKNEETKTIQKLLPVILFIISIVISIILIAAALTGGKNKNDNIEIQEQKTVEISQKEKENENNFVPEKKEITESKTKPPVQPNKVQTGKQTVKQQNKSTSDTKKTVRKAPSQKTKTTNTVKTVQEQKKQQTQTVKPKSDIKNADTQKADIQKTNIPDTSAADKAKLNTYKANLRQYLFSAFPILTVQGSGTASVGFSVSSEGKLINRRFVLQSDNKSLNDAMYHMLMKAPVYTAPPSCYKGEEFILEMKYNNGRYSFSYLK